MKAENLDGIHAAKTKKYIRIPADLDKELALDALEKGTSKEAVLEDILREWYAE